LKYDIDYVPNPKHYIKFGAGVTYHTFEPGATQFESENIQEFEDAFSFGSEKVYASEFDVYVEDDWEVTNKLKINGGLHASGFLVMVFFTNRCNRVLVQGI
jgi:hypothetical protein